VTDAPSHLWGFTMKRLILTAALFSGIIVTASTTSIEAQTKKDSPTKPAPAKLGEVEIYKGKAGMRWRIVDSEGKTIAMPPASKTWDTKEEVLKSLEELKETLNKAKPVDVKE
jgi:peptidoglycan hydrolase CwlO-like protein